MTGDTTAFQEPELPNVHAEDRVIVRNVLYAAQACLQGELQLDNWAITVTDKHYVINIYLSTNNDFDVNVRDMQTIMDVNPLRVASVNVSKQGSAPPSLRVCVSNRDQPITLIETDVVRDFVPWDLTQYHLDGILRLGNDLGTDVEEPEDAALRREDVAEHCDARQQQRLVECDPLAHEVQQADDDVPYSALGVPFVLDRDHVEQPCNREGALLYDSAQRRLVKDLRLAQVLRLPGHRLGEADHVARPAGRAHTLCAAAGAQQPLLPAKQHLRLLALEDLPGAVAAQHLFDAGLHEAGHRRRRPLLAAPHRS
eukprot:3035774-Rhodomonas_salina.2